MTAAREALERMPTTPLATHLMLVVVPIVFGLGAIAFHLLRGRRER